MLGLLRWSMPKLRNQMQNYLKYTNKTSDTFFLGNVIYDFLSTKVLQGSVGTCVNYGRKFIEFFTYCKFTAENDGNRILKIG